jgi:hypothetical protein
LIGIREGCISEAWRDHAFPGISSFLVDGRKLIEHPTVEVLKYTIDSILVGKANFDAGELGKNFDRIYLY